jgi:NAD(P)-dependent dehydrogenase (short-subunit alcohol dehydrogenase family)
MVQIDLTDRPLSSLYSLEGRVAVITGGARGIGFATARRLQEAGASVVLVDKDGETLSKAAERLDGATELNVDVTDDGALAGVAEHVVSALGGIDIWANIAGIYPSTPILEMSEDEWDAVVDLNLRATFVGAREAGRVMKDAGRGGVIINIGSLNAHLALGPGFPHYTSTKHGVLGLTKALAAELGPHRIRVVAVSPQLTQTEGVMAMSGAFVDEGVQEMIDAYAARTPLGRVGLPDDVARTILFAVSDLAGYVTGSELMADGGALAFG